MQIKATVTYYYTPIKMSIATLKTPNADENVEQQGPSIYCCWEGKSFQKTVWQFLTKLIILLRYGTAVTLFGIYPKEYRKPMSAPNHR